HYLIIDEELTEENLRQEIETAGGTYVLTSIQGEEISVSLEGENVVLTDAAGNKATVVESNRDASNGVIHVIDGIMKPSDLTINEAGNVNRNQNQNNTARDTASTTNSGM